MPALPDALTIAAAELEKILAIDPRNITARMARMAQLLEQGRLKKSGTIWTFCSIAPS